MPDAEFSTDHNVKGEEYNNILFTISRGWNNYNFDEYLPRMNEKISDDKIKKSFERNRNLFYVCCSRPKKRLFIFVSVIVNREFEQFLRKISNDSYYEFAQFVQEFTD